MASRSLALRGLSWSAQCLADAVQLALGPKGRNVGLDETFSSPLSTKGGVTVAKAIELGTSHLGGNGANGTSTGPRTNYRERSRDVTAAAEAPGMEGRIEVIGVPGLLQMCALGRLSGVLSILRAGSGGRPAVVRFKEGEIVSAEAGGPTGPDAIYELLEWSEGIFSFSPGAVEGSSLEQGLTELLLEGCRRLDEKRRAQEASPPE